LKLTKEETKRIKKYSKLRGDGNPGLSYKILKSVYISANDDKRKEFDREMSQYFKAIEDKKIEKGQSILHMIMHR
jgi:hypothetical protein